METIFTVAFKSAKNLSYCVPADCLVTEEHQIGARTFSIHVRQSATHNPHRTAAESFARMLKAQTHIANYSSIELPQGDPRDPTFVSREEADRYHEQEVFAQRVAGYAG